MKLKLDRDTYLCWVESILYPEPPTSRALEKCYSTYGYRFTSKAKSNEVTDGKAFEDPTCTPAPQKLVFSRSGISELFGRARGGTRDMEGNQEMRDVPVIFDYAF